MRRSAGLTARVDRTISNNKALHRTGIPLRSIRARESCR